MSEPHPDRSRHGHVKQDWKLKIKIFGFLFVAFGVLSIIGLGYVFGSLRRNAAKMLTKLKKKNKDIAEN